ncbi:MAG: glycoside hydrolase family 32 protein, partial [Oscillospiraceae bacterium]|nr:glycoside hydrolase family 32 protein [Oscillospiraceae bacterium]
HMFYQYHPYDSHWGPMHWGHAVSTDLLHWEYLPVVMAPDMPYDRDGCFSGSAVTLPDGRHMLMYTGVRDEVKDSGETLEYQTQNLAFGNGLDYEKYEHNPVITAADLPENGSASAFRDPRIWQEKDGTYRAVIANNEIGRGGRMLVYRSADALHWEFSHVLAENNNRIGLMWECPDFFELDGKYVLLASAQDMLPKGFEYHNGNGTFCMIGGYDEASHRFTAESDYAIDYGIDFYAPQTVLTPDGRRVMIGWMQNWDTCDLPLHTRPWFGQMSLPRELSVKGGRLYQMPIRELEALRYDEAEYKDVVIEDEEITLPGVSGRLLDMEVEIEPAGEVFAKFGVKFARNEDYHTRVSFRPKESILKIDRKFSGSRRAIVHERRAKVSHENGKIKLRVILDRFSAEVFVNDGEKVLSVTVDTDLSVDGISFYVNGRASFSVKKYILSTN